VFLSSVVCYGGLCVLEQCSVLRWAVLLGSAVCCYGRQCVAEQCSMLLWRAVCCWAVQNIAMVVCLLSSAVCCYVRLRC